MRDRINRPDLFDLMFVPSRHIANILGASFLTFQEELAFVLF